MAKKVLEGKTKGYRNHPQLLRFRRSGDPLKYINLYLSFIIKEASRRGYRFDRGKIDWEQCSGARCYLDVTSGQLEFEKKHLLSKLFVRDRMKFEELDPLGDLEPHPLFLIVEGEVEEWERNSEFRIQIQNDALTDPSMSGSKSDV